MGKSSKKIKSDRINALRKQYDAFLEDDKKRKERNEYILGRLDKMRYTTALVPLRHKAGIIPDRNAAIYSSGRHQDKKPATYMNASQIISESPISNIGSVSESYIIQEISKNYILIPKLRSTPTKNYIHEDDTTPNIDPIGKINAVPKELKISDAENTDWKRKYEILNILKKEEKGESQEPGGSPIQFNQETSQNKSPQNLVNDNNMKIVNEPAVFGPRENDVGHKICNELKENYFPEKDSYELSVNNNNNAPQDSDSYGENTCHDIVEEHSENRPINPDVFNESVAHIAYDLQHSKIEYNNSDPPINNLSTSAEFPGHEPVDDVNTTFTNHYPQNVVIEPEHEVNTTYDSNNQDNLVIMQNVEYHAEEVSSKQLDLGLTEQNKDRSSAENHVPSENVNNAPMVNSTEFVERDSKTPIPTKCEPLVDDVEYPIDAINVQEFTPNEGIKLQDGIIINSDSQQQPYISPQSQDIQQLVAETDQSQNPADTTGIEEFEAEQQGMFYSEQTGENYAYQEGGGDVYNPEYAETEQYHQNEEYALYEGTDPAVNINEHEETSQAYDQSYEQQYVGSYEQGYEQQPYEQHDQQYQESEAYPTQPELEQINYMPQNEDSPQNVQQTLDNEQGFTEIQNSVQVNESERPSAKTNEAAKEPSPENPMELVEAS